jgi:hypothetical protein
MRGGALGDGGVRTVRQGDTSWLAALRDFYRYQAAHRLLAPAVSSTKGMII